MVFRNRYLPLAVFIFFALSCILHPQSALRTQQFADTDDYMRLNQLIAWLQSAHPFGSGWYDLGAPRISPGDHVVIHWARLVDVPLALIMLPLLPWLSVHSAALVASFIVPPLLFALLLILMPALARPVVGEVRMDLAAVMLLFAPAVLMNYLPGRVDHHGYQILIAAFGLFCLQRLILEQDGRRAAIMAAVAFAAGLWIGTEALPWLILFTVSLAGFAAWRGGVVLKNAAVFGLALPLAVVVVMPLALPPAEYTSRALSWFSGADLIFAVLAGAALGCGWWGGRRIKEKHGRLALMAALGCCAAVLFVWFVPDAWNGPFADYDDFNSTLALENIGEAQPFWPSLHVSFYSPLSFLHAALLCLHTIYLPLLALSVIGWNMAHKRRERVMWSLHGIFLLPALLMTLFWQVRIGWFAQIFSLVPVAWLVWRVWDACAARFKFRERPRFWAEIGVFILIAPLPVILFPALVGQARFYSDLLLFPAARAAQACPLLHASDFLNERYGDRPRVIMSGMNEGPELLFRTSHSVIAAPYNVSGNQDAFDFFNARKDQAARAILARRQVDLVLICRNIPLFYASLGDATARLHAYLYTDQTGQLRMMSSKEHPTLIERLVNNDVPYWLKPIEIPQDPDYLLFAVRN